MYQYIGNLKYIWKTAMKVQFKTFNIATAEK